MGSHTMFRWIIAAVLVLGVVALLAWRRNDPGVGDRFPDESMGRVTVVMSLESSDAG